MRPKSFVLVFRYSDGSGFTVIYVGSDKGDALDALLAAPFSFDKNGLSIEYDPGYHESITARVYGR